MSIATGGKSHEEALGVPMLQGSRLAIEEWNARGGYRKRRIPFELVVSNDNGLWGSSGNEIVKLAYNENVWGILGTIDGANSHIAIRVALKAEVLMINTGDTDPTFIETNIPWVARVIGDDRQQAYLLTDYWYRKLGLKRVAHHPFEQPLRPLRRARDPRQRKAPAAPDPHRDGLQGGAEGLRARAERIKNANPDGVVHWGDAVEGALILNTMREMGMTQPFFGSDRTVNEEFAKIAGKNAEGVVAAFPWNPERKDPKLERFKKAYRERFGVEAETYAAHAYDGMNLMLWAINAAGLNRERSATSWPSCRTPGRGSRGTSSSRLASTTWPTPISPRTTTGGGLCLANPARHPEGVHRAARPAEPGCDPRGWRRRAHDRDGAQVT